MVVSPPGFVITKSEILISSGILFVYLIILTFLLELVSSTSSSNCFFILSFFPDIAITCKLEKFSIIDLSILKTLSFPKPCSPPAKNNIVFLSGLNSNSDKILSLS